MEENISHAIEMTFSVFLFIFALSCAILSYSKMEAVAEQMISINLVNRRGTTADTKGQEQKIYRETDYGEIVLAALNLEKIYLTSKPEERVEYKVIVKGSGGGEISFKYKRDETPNDLGEIESAVGQIIMKFNGSDVDNFLVSTTGDDTSLYAGFLNSLKGYGIKAGKKYHISYTDDSIIFTEI